MPSDHLLFEWPRISVDIIAVIVQLSGGLIQSGASDTTFVLISTLLSNQKNCLQYKKKDWPNEWHSKEDEILYHIGHSCWIVLDRLALCQIMKSIIFVYRISQAS